MLLFCKNYRNVTLLALNVLHNLCFLGLQPFKPPLAIFISASDTTNTWNSLSKKMKSKLPIVASGAVSAFPTSPTRPLRLSWGLNPAVWNKRPILSSVECVRLLPSHQLAGVSACGAEHEGKMSRAYSRESQSKDCPRDSSEKLPHLVHREMGWFTPKDKLPLCSVTSRALWFFCFVQISVAASRSKFLRRSCQWKLPIKISLQGTLVFLYTRVI